MSNFWKAIHSVLQCFSPGYDQNHKNKWKLWHFLKLNAIIESFDLKIITVDTEDLVFSSYGKLTTHSAKMSMK